MSEIYDTASEAEAVDGVVHVTGPDDVEVKLTPKAALNPAGRIDEAALDALLESNAAEHGKGDLRPLLAGDSVALMLTGNVI